MPFFSSVLWSKHLATDVMIKSKRKKKKTCLHCFADCEVVILSTAKVFFCPPGINIILIPHVFVCFVSINIQ